jgi:hypothetical protein
MTRNRYAQIAGVVLLAGSALLVLMTGALQASASPTGPTSTDGESERATSYTAPTGPELTPEQAEKIAVGQAREAGESAALHVSVARGSFMAAQAVLDGQPPSQAQIPPGAAPDTREWLASSAYLVVMQGRRFVVNAPVPRGEAEPSGTVMATIVEAHTGFPEGRYVGEEMPKTSELGPVVTFDAPGETAGESPSALSAGRPHSRSQAEILGRFYVRGRHGMVPARDMQVVLGKPGAHGELVGKLKVVAKAPTEKGGEFYFNVKQGTYVIAGRRSNGKLCAARLLVAPGNRETHVTLNCRR